MQQSYFVHTQQKDDSCEHQWMCTEGLLGGLDHVHTQTNSGKSPHTVVSLHIYTTHLKFISASIFLWCWSMNWQGLGTQFWWILWQLCRETTVTVFSSTLHQCFQRQPIKHMDRVNSGSYENPGMWILKPTQSNSSAFRDAEGLPPAKKQHFYGDTQYVTSSGSHAGKLWPLAISWTKIDLVSQPTPPK